MLDAAELPELVERYHLILADPIRRGEYRPLKTPELPDLASA